MRRLLLFPALLLTFHAVSGAAAAQNGATATVTANPATITAGGAVGLTATIDPNNVSVSAGHAFTKPTGTITFLDGTASLDNTPIALVPNTFAGATFQQTFGTPGATLTAPTIFIPGELTGDLNGDGVADLLVYREVDPNPGQFAVQPFLSDGKGGYTPGAVQTFSIVGPGVSYPSVTNAPILIDLNGDGKLDLLNGVEAANGNGDGTFAAVDPVSFLSPGFVSAYAADLNGDGKTDLLAVNTTSYPALQFSVTVFLNQGGGSFSSAGTFPIGSGGMEDIFTYPPTFLDLNGDGKLDVVLQWSPVLAGTPNVSVLLNSGSGTLGNPMQLTVPYPPNIGEPCLSYQTGSGDLNRDGKEDLILALCDHNGNSDAISFLGNGDGTFGSPVFFALSTPPDVIIPILPNFIVQDVDLDGKLDLVFGSGRLALGNGDGTFSSAAPLFPPPASPDYSYPLLQIDLAGNPVPSLVYLIPSATPPPVAVFTPQTSSSAALSVTTLKVGTHTISARYSGDANYPADTSAAVAVMVTAAPSVTAATSSASPSFAGQSVTLTANVTSNGPAPTGNVTFTSGSTTLGTVALSGGSAAYTVSFNDVGTQAITASYSGDANTAGSSAAISQVVNAAFTLSNGGSTTTLTAKSGQAVISTIIVTGATGFSGQVTVACSGLPANASCAFNPATLAVSGPSTSSSGTLTASVSTLTINTSSRGAMNQARQDGGGRPGTVIYGLVFAGLAWFWPMRRRGGGIWIILVCGLAVAGLGLGGCSNGSGSSPAAQTAPGTYNFTVTATSGKVETEAAYTLLVQ